MGPHPAGLKDGKDHRRASGAVGASALIASAGRIPKRGKVYLRALLIQGPKSALIAARKRQDPISRRLVSTVFGMLVKKAF